jgi:DNA-binding transcriptional ArsR family regulator
MKSKCPDPHTDSTRLARILFALADPIRLRMLNMMLAGEVSSKDIARVLRVDAAAVSRHIISLQSGELISTRRRGLTWYYFIRKNTERNDVECQVIQLVFTSFRSQPDMQADLALLNKIVEKRPPPKVRKRRNTSKWSQARSARLLDSTTGYDGIVAEALTSVILRSAEIPNTEHRKA